MASGQLRAEIVIVDATPSDYTDLVRLADESDLSVRFLRTGGEALQAAGKFQPGLWIVNVRLPDMSGFDVVETLRSEGREARFFFVADAYQAEEEIRSRLLNAAAYLCKPVQREWITAWISQTRKGASRATGEGQGPNPPKIRCLSSHTA